MFIKYVSTSHIHICKQNNFEFMKYSQLSLLVIHSIESIIIIIIIIIQWLYNPLRTRAYQPTASLTSYFSADRGERSCSQLRGDVWSERRILQQLFFTLQIRITATNQQLPKFSILLAWHLYMLPGTVKQYLSANCLAFSLQEALCFYKKL